MYKLSLTKMLDQYKQNQPILSLDIAIFLQQFSTLISAGIPLLQCLEILEKSQKKIAMRHLLSSIKHSLLTGKNLSFCIKQNRMHFDDLTCQLIQIGEYTGKLDVMLHTVSQYQEKKLAFKKRIQEVLFYPCMIAVVSLIIAFFMFIFIIPRFAELFQTSQIKLSILTTCLFHIAKVVNDNLIILFLVFITLFLLVFLTKIKYIIYNYLHYFVTRLPFIKQCLHKIILARFARNLAISFTAGIPIKESLKLAANASSNLEFIDIIARLRSKISAGFLLHHAMMPVPYFPVLMVQMIKIGEESGMLDHMLDKIADFFESEIEQFLSQISQLLEPLIMLILGAVIGGMIIGMYLPIFKLGSAI